MIISNSLPFIRNYIAAVNEAIQQHNPDHKLSRLQSYWLSFIILGLLVTNAGHAMSALVWEGVYS